MVAASEGIQEGAEGPAYVGVHHRPEAPGLPEGLVYQLLNQQMYRYSIRRRGLPEGLVYQILNQQMYRYSIRRRGKGGAPNRL